MMTFIFWIGWIGAILVLSAFAGLSWGWLKQGYTFQLMNLFGGVGLFINAAGNNSVPIVCLNLVWIVISITAIIKMRNAKND